MPAPEFAIRQPQLVMRPGIVRLEANHLLASCYRFLVAAESAIRHHQTAVRQGIVRRKANRLLESRQRLVPASAPDIFHSQVVVRLNFFFGLPRGLFALWGLM